MSSGCLSIGVTFKACSSDLHNSSHKAVCFPFTAKYLTNSWTYKSSSQLLIWSTDDKTTNEGAFESMWNEEGDNQSRHNPRFACRSAGTTWRERCENSRFPRMVLERVPAEYKFGELLLHRVMKDFLWIQVPAQKLWVKLFSPNVWELAQIKLPLFFFFVWCLCLANHKIFIHNEDMLPKLLRVRIFYTKHPENFITLKFKIKRP